MDKELNKKLAEWAGFKYRPTEYQHSMQTEPYWEYPDGGWDFDLVNFPNSLDACFEWLVLKLPYIFVFDLAEGVWACFIKGCDGAPNKTEGYGETPSLALCKAIEKLIDGAGEGV